MTLFDLLSDLIDDTKGLAENVMFTDQSSLGLFQPEMILCVTVVAMLFVRLFSWGQRFDVFYLALAGSVSALLVAAPWTLWTESIERTEIFTGMLVYDGLTVFIRGILLFFLVLFLLFTKLSGIPDQEDAPDIYTLVFGSTLGMCLMASANHLMMVFMAVEMASVPSYALAGMLKGRRQASEAALKYSIYGAGAAGVMLYGLSLVAGMLNTAHLPTLAIKLSELLPELTASGESGQLLVLAIGGLLISAGLAFKLSAVPFHFWCPDVFEGAAAEVNAFLSVASKAAALALLVRVAIGFGTIPVASAEPEEATESIAAVAGMFSIEDRVNASGDEAVAASTAAKGPVRDLSAARSYMGHLIAFLAIITCTFGNLAAYGQRNIKRLLAYSTIAHAGYMMMAVPPVLAVAEISPETAQFAIAALGIYIAVYVFMNLGAFAVVAFLRNAMRSEEIADYAGLIRRCPGLVICFSAILFSLVGLPPLAGFIGKFAIFGALADGWLKSSQSYLLVLLIAGGINTAISLFYYLGVVKTMTLDPEPESRAPFELSLVSLQGMFVFALSLPIFFLMIGWNGLSEMAQAAAKSVLG